MGQSQVIHVHILCRKAGYKEELEDMGIEQPTEYREAMLFKAQITCIYKDNVNGGCFIDCVNGADYSVIETYEEIKAMI